MTRKRIKWMGKTFEFRAEAFIGISNSGGIELMTENGDTVYYRFNHGQDLSKERVYYSDIDADPDDESQVGFYHGKVFYSLTDAMRIK